MKRFVIALIFLALALVLALYSDAKTEAVFKSLRAEFVELNKIADEGDIPAMQAKAHEISELLSKHKKIMYFLSDHTVFEQIERNVKTSLEETDANEIKRYCGDSIADCDGIIESCRPHIWNIF